MVVEEEGGGGGNDRVRWGTWEELILGGAVLRHGSLDWDAVAKEVQTRTRTLYPYLFTPQVCKAKYDALQERYSGCSAWFEELRKRRVEELHRALEISDDSIGSLQSKLVSLTAEKKVCNNAGYSSSTASPVSFFRFGGNDSSGKEASKDGSSAGSFTHETETTWSHLCQAGTEASAEETEKKPVVLEPSRLERFPSIDELAETMRSEHGVSIKKRRGKRRRKDVSKDVKEGSVGENNFISSADIMTTSQGKEKITSYSDHPSGALDAIDHNTCLKRGSTASKKRRKELRKDLEEGRVEENNLISSADVTTTSQSKETLINGSDQPSRPLDANDHKPFTSKQGTSEAKKRKDLSKDVKEKNAEKKALISSADIMMPQGKEKLTSYSGQPSRSPDANDQSPSTSKRIVSNFKKRRKDPSKDVKERSVEKNALISSADIMTSQCKAKLTSAPGHLTRVTDGSYIGPCTSKHEGDEFTTILESIMENEHASVFRRRLDSQKRARYRSIVRQHMDLDTIRSRIANRCIKSMADLLRDLLLVANNALVFYSRITREYRCALVLRDLVTKRLHRYYKSVGNKIVTPQIQKSPVRRPPAKPRSARPFNRKPSNKEANVGSSIVILPNKEGKQAASTVGSPSSAESSALTKKSLGRRGKVGRVKRGTIGIQAESPMKVRKNPKSKYQA